MADTPGTNPKLDKLAHRGGLTWALRLDGKGNATAVDWDTLESDPLGSKIDGDLWAHFDRSAPRVRTWLAELAHVPHAAIAPLTEDDPRPRCSVFRETDRSPSGVLLILRGVNLNPESNPEDMVSIRLWIDEHRVLSFPQRHVVAAKTVQEQLLRGTGPRESCEFLVQLAETLLDRLDPVLARLDSELTGCEEKVTRMKPEALRETLADLRRVIIRLRRHMAPQREVLALAAERMPEWFLDTSREGIKALAERAAFMVDELDELRDRATVVHDELTVHVGERMSRVSTRLTVVASIFLPLGLITSLWGMNVRGIPLEQTDGGFWILLAAMALIAGGLWGLAAWSGKK